MACLVSAIRGLRRRHRYPREDRRVRRRFESRDGDPHLRSCRRSFVACYLRALQLGPASKVASINKLSVVLVIIAAANFLREPVPFSTAIGGGLVLADVLTLAFV